MKILRFAKTFIIISVLLWQYNALAQKTHFLYRQPVTENLGVNIHFYEGVGKDWEMLADAGVGIVRMDAFWHRTETQPGRYELAHHDSLVNKLSDRGLKLIFILDYGNKLYDEESPSTDEGRAAFARFAKELVKRYPGREIIWELWNEPNLDMFWRLKSNYKDYMKWCKVVTKAIRSVDKDAFIVGPATSTIDFRFLEDCFRSGLLELVDGVTIHPYRSVPQSPESAYEEIQLLQALINIYKSDDKDIPVLSGEWGYSTSFMTRELHGKYLPRQWLSNISAGVPLSIWYDWHDDGKNIKEMEHNFGTVTWDYKPKPAFVAVKKLNAELKGFVYLTRFDIGASDDYVLLFKNDDRFKIAIWTRGAEHEALLDSFHLLLTDRPEYLLPDKQNLWWMRLSSDIYDSSKERCNRIINDYFNRNEDGDEVAILLLKKIEYHENIQLVYSLLIQLAEHSDKMAAVRVYKKILTHEDSGEYNRKASVYGIIKNGGSEDIVILQSVLNDSLLVGDASNGLMFNAYNLARIGEIEKARNILQSGLELSQITFFKNRAAEICQSRE